MRTKHKGQLKYILLALGFSSVFVLSLLPSLGETGAVDTSNSVTTTQTLSYEFRTYALNCTSQKHTQNGTLFRFSAADLPFAFSAISFGDYRSDTTYSHKYYGGSGILMNATGENATFVLKEGSGRFISSIDYKGQAQVVFNGMIESVTYPTNLTTYEGTEQIIQDWRNGLWAPSDGVIVEHPAKTSLAGAKFYVMVLEPVAATDIPEFGLVPIVAVVTALFIVLRKVATKA